MRAPLALIPVLGLLAGCHPRFAVGYDARPRAHGAMAAMKAPPADALTAGTPAVPDGGDYSFAAGGGAKDFTISGALELHDVTRDGPYLTAAAGLDFDWRLIRYRWFSTAIHVGPRRTVMVDRDTGEREWGYGLRYGVGVAVAVSVIEVFADLHRDSLQFDFGPAAGDSSLSGLTLGLALRL